MQNRMISMAFLLLVAISASAVWAGDDDETGRQTRDRVLRSVQKGEVLPLPKLRHIVLARWPGELLGVEIDEEHGTLSYAFKVLTEGGRLTEIEIDARTGKIIEVENE
jgi:uncharacterized membrane protein YkoI